MIIASEERNACKDVRFERLEKLLIYCKHALFGANSEKAHPDQYHLALEDIETAMAAVHDEDEAVDSPKTELGKRKLVACYPNIWHMLRRSSHQTVLHAPLNMSVASPAKM